MRRILTVLVAVAALAAYATPAACAAGTPGKTAMPNGTAAVEYLQVGCVYVTPGNGHYGLVCTILDHDTATGSYRGHITIHCYTAAGNEPCSRISFPGSETEGAHVDLVAIHPNGNHQRVGSAKTGVCKSFGTCPRNGVSQVTAFHTLGAGDCYQTEVYAQVNIGTDHWNVPARTSCLRA